MQQQKKEALVGGWTAKVEEQDGKAVGIWVPEEIDPVVTQLIHSSAEGQENGGKANYLDDL
jgi:hypothetical protein